MTSTALQRGVVLVHGAYADGSSWSEVIVSKPAPGPVSTPGRVSAAGYARWS